MTNTGSRAADSTPPPVTPRSLTTKAGILVVSRAMTIITQLASVMVLTRVLAKESVAALLFLLLLVATAVTLAQLGLPESVFYFFERLPRGSRKRFIYLTCRNLLVLGVGACLVVALLTFGAPFWRFDLRPMFVPLAALILIELVTLPLPNVLIAIERVGAAGVFNITASALQFVALILPALLGFPIETIAYALLLYSVGRLVLAVLLFVRYFPGPSERLPASTTRDQFVYSIPLGLSQLLWGLNRQIDKYIVAGFLPATALAEYFVGSWELPLIPMIAYSVSAVMMPSLVSFHASHQADSLLDLWRRSIRKVSLIVLPSAVLFLVVAEEFIATFFSADYLAAALPFRIYTVIVFQRVAAYSAVFKAIGETKIIYRSALYLVGINLALSFPLVIWLGMAGPALATLCANLFTWGYSITKMGQAFGARLSDVFPFQHYLKVLLVALVAGVPALLLKALIDLSWTPKLLLLASTYLVSYAALAAVTRLVRPRDWRLVLRPTTD